MNIEEVVEKKLEVPLNSAVSQITGVAKNTSARILSVRKKDKA